MATADQGGSTSTKIAIGLVVGCSVAAMATTYLTKSNSDTSCGVRSDLSVPGQYVTAVECNGPCENVSLDDEPRIALSNDYSQPERDTSSSLDDLDPDFPDEGDLPERNSSTESWI